ncbi:Na+/H+ antiporter subunit E [Streptomyces sp. NPDC002838]|uniref:Na+/H+ antiporter subunit E n=1 Tax=Streptomyces sp. NPDC002838 TaxID=3154436 RepID=UPI003322F78F
MIRMHRTPRGPRHLPMIAWLWLLWLLLWGTISPVVLVGGLLAATAVVMAFSLPSVLPGMVPRPLRTGRLLVHVLTDLARSGTMVSWQVLRHGGRVPSAVIEVPLHVDSDFLIAAVAEVTTMTPGTLVVEIDRHRRRLYVHALPVRDRRDMARRRKEVQTVERRVMRAVGHGHRTGGHRPPPDPPENSRRHFGGRQP